jgi:hypothetical protein
MTYTGSADVTMSGEGSAAASVSLAGSTNNPPGQPVIIWPKDGDTLTSPIHFIWDSEAARMLAMTDSDGDEVTYALNICSNPEMSEGCQTYQLASLGGSLGRFALAGIALIGLVGFAGGRRRVGILIIALLLAVGFASSCGNSSSDVAGDYEHSVDLAPGTYYWNVTATDSSGASTTSETRTLIVQ